MGNEDGQTRGREARSRAKKIAQKEPVQSPERPEHSETPRIRVIVAEDHPVLRTALQALLKSQPDFEVVAEAAEGTEVVRLACELVPDVVVMDIGLPGMDGIESTRMIKSGAPTVKVLALSGQTNTQMIESMAQAGASGFIPKSAVVTGLAPAIRVVASGGVCECSCMQDGPP